jgi:RND family efflux transporter MFP subunit
MSNASTKLSVFRFWPLPAAMVVCALFAGTAVIWVLVGVAGTEPVPSTHVATDGQVGQTANAQSSLSEGVARVKVVRPTIEDLQRTTTQPAHVEPYEKTDILAKASGYLAVVQVDIGDRVEKDQELAHLWIPEMEQEYQQKLALVDRADAQREQARTAVTVAEAMVKTAEAETVQVKASLSRYESEVAYRRSEHQRFDRLAQENAIPRDQSDERLNQLQSAEASLAAANAEIQTAEAKLQVERAQLAQSRANVKHAESDVKVAQANLQHLKVLLDYASIRAPYAGVITHRLFDTGAFIQSAATSSPPPLFTIMREDRLRIITDIPEADSAWIRIGQPAVLRIGSSLALTFRGKVARFADALDQSTRTMRTEIELDGSTEGLRPGMYGSIAITLADYPQSILLPASSIVYDGDVPSVKLIEGDHCAVRRVELGINDGVRVQVTSGLSADDLVITGGQSHVCNGQTVEIVQ